MVCMDFWPLKYFLAVARSGNLTRAAETLHISQPALSMRLAELERELGHPLFVRGPRGMALTEKGALLMRRAEDLVGLAERIESEVRADDDQGLSGTLAIGAGETVAFAPVADAIKSLCAENPNLRIDLTSGNGEDIQSRIQSGTIDLALFVGPGRYRGYDYITMPHVLTYNAAVMVAAGFGAAVCIDGLIPSAYAGRLVFRPFSPILSSDAYLAWRKDITLSPAASALISRIRTAIAGKTKNG